MRRIVSLFVLSAAALALAACGNGKTPSLQGWVEAELIFVSPDEQGRVEQLNVRRGRKASRRHAGVPS